MPAGRSTCPLRVQTERRRSNLWKPADWPARKGLPSLAQTMVDGGALPISVAALEQILKQDEVERMY
jgi:hypothetical protein